MGRETPSQIGLIYGSDVLVSDEQLHMARDVLTTFCGEFISRFYNLPRLAAAWTKSKDGGVGFKLELYLEAYSSAKFSSQYWSAANVGWNSSSGEISARICGETDRNNVRAGPFMVGLPAGSFREGLIKLLRVVAEMADAFEESAGALASPPPSVGPSLN